MSSCSLYGVGDRLSILPCRNFQKGFRGGYRHSRSREGFCRGLAIALAYCYGAGRKEKYEVRLRYRWRRLRRRHPGSPDVRGPRGIGAAGGAARTIPNFSTFPKTSSLDTTPAGTLLLCAHQAVTQYPCWTVVTTGSMLRAPPKCFRTCRRPGARLPRGSSAINSSAFYRGVPKTSTTGPRWATTAGASGRSCPTSGKLRPMWTTTTDFHGADGPIFVHHSRREDWRPAQEAF